MSFCSEQLSRPFDETIVMPETIIACSPAAALVLPLVRCDAKRNLKLNIGDARSYNKIEIKITQIRVTKIM